MDVCKKPPPIIWGGAKGEKKICKDIVRKRQRDRKNEGRDATYFNEERPSGGDGEFLFDFFHKERFLTEERERDERNEK